MKGLQLYNKKTISHRISPRSGETKLGEEISFVSRLEDLENSDTAFVLLGIPEDIGVRANRGKAGTANAWDAFLNAFLNIQENRFIKGSELAILGEIDTTSAMEKAENIDISDPNYHEKLGDLVSELDEVVAGVVEKIISSGKFPIILGGGHNNAYGNLKGASNALKKAMNVLNIDAHTDLRMTDFRHSGNGFSFARKNGFLRSYSVFGLHENYTPEYIFKEIHSSEDLHCAMLNDLSEGYLSIFQRSLDHVRKDDFGFEIDCDSIANFPSSAISPSGLNLDQVRRLVKHTAKEKKCSYLHICEAVATNHFPTGKAISYLVSDFIKARMR